MSAFATPRRPAEQRRPVRPSRRRFAIALALESATLAVFATLHLTGTLRIGAGRSYGAGVAEALICVALLAGAVALYRWPARGGRVALSALAFAIFGFFVGLSFTVGSGDTIDLVYHLVMLPVFVATGVVLLVHRPASPTRPVQNVRNRPPTPAPPGAKRPEPPTHPRATGT